ELSATSGYGGPFSTAGKVVWGHETAVGHFPQDHRTSIEPGMALLEWLGQMMFPREDAEKRTEVLSGGEAARLLFCKLMLQKPNVLLLDEPTNHMDLESINALNVAIQKYEGTVLLVTHDHDLIEEVATRIWHFDHGKIEDFKCTYDEYVASVATA